MGAAISSNVAKQIISSSTDIANSYVQECTGTGGQIFGLNVSNGCTATIGPINITNEQVLNVKCVQNVTTRNNIKTTIQSQIAQQAAAAAQSIGGPSLSFASDVNNFAEGAASQITNLYTQKCLDEGIQSQGITCTDPSSSLTVAAINVKNTQSEYANCVNDATTINGLVTDLANLISQQTNAKEANTLSSFVIAGLLFLGLIAFAFIYTLKGPAGWIIIAIVAIIVIAVVIYATVAYSNKLYPFNQKTSVN